MTPAGEPVSVYDLVGLQVSSNGGVLVYLVVLKVPLTKILITGEDNFNTHFWLSVSPYVLSKIAAGPSYSRWTLPRTTTEVATIGDTVSTFQVLKINRDSVNGFVLLHLSSLLSIRKQDYQDWRRHRNRCEAYSEKLAIIDFADQIVVFTRIQGQPP